MRHMLTAGVSGLLFGAGLAVSGMINPAKVLGFLDPFGAWDPTLAFVMAGALIPMAVAWTWTRRRGSGLLGDAPPPKASSVVDRPLVLGAVLFGVGWGLVGLCPGPAIAGLLFGGPSLWIFVTAMAVGMLVHRAAHRT